MLIGYTCVPAADQSVETQVEALREAGCERVFTDVARGRGGGRSGWENALSHTREGDVLVVGRLDRFAGSLSDLVKKIERLRKRGVDFRSLEDGIDTTGSTDEERGGEGDATGDRIAHVFHALAAFEREVMRARTRPGRTSARAENHNGGRPPSMTMRKVELAAKLMADPSVEVKEVCRAVGVSKSTLYRYVGPDGTIRKWPDL